MNFDSSHAIFLKMILFQACGNEEILYVSRLHKCININYKTVNMYKVFVWLVQGSPCWKLHIHIAAHDCASVFSEVTHCSKHAQLDVMPSSI